VSAHHSPQRFQYYVLDADGEPVGTDDAMVWARWFEDGKRLRLPVNRFATSLMRPVLQPDDVLVGDVLLCTPGEAGEGEEADDPDRP
jgi:hypothetical protein